MSIGKLDFHRLQASSAAEQAVLIDGNAGGYQAADLYEQAAEHLNRVIELTGTNCN
jgi:hypothetical protein